MTQSPKSIPLFLISLFLFSVSAAFATNGNNHASFEFDETDMGTNTVDADAAWHGLNKAARKKFINDFKHRRNRRELYDEYVGTIGGAAILDYLERVDPRCHGKAHALGTAIFAQNKDINLSLQICGNHCTNACMHGVIKEAFGDHGREAVQKMMNNFCSQGEMGRLHKSGNCAHGIGHALMLLSEHNISESLEDCRGFKQPGMDYYCATGVFMEYRDMLGVNKRLGKPISRPDLHYPCNTNTEYPAACYRYMIRQIAKELDADRPTLIKICLGLPPHLKAGCFHGLGAMYSRRVADDPKIFVDLCSHGNATDQILCVEGVIEKMADFDQKRALNTCSFVSGGKREICEASAKEKMYRLDKRTMPLYRNSP